MKQYNRTGMSLPVVLITMVLATLVGTALYRVLTKEGESSAAQMQQASAVAAAKAGLEATKSWLTFNSLEAKGLLETYRDLNAAGTFVPVQIPLDATVAANSREQFTVLLTGIYYVPSSPEVSVKVQVIGTGKAGATSVLTAVLKLEGMVTVENNIQTPLLDEKYLGDDDAIHVSGDGTGFNSGSTVHGSLYLGGGWVLQSKLVVDNNLVVANGSVTGNSCITVGGSAYIAGRLRIQNCPVEVQGSMRVGYIDPNGQNVTVGLGATGGDLYVDSVYNQSAITILARKSSDGASKGNIYLGKYYSGMNGIMEAQGDLEVASGIAAGAVTYSNGGYIKAGKDMLVNSAVDPSGNRFTFAGSHGFYVSGAETPVSTGLGALHEGPLFDGLTPGSYVTRADDLDELKDKLSTSAQKKPQPYQLSMDTFNLYQKKWSSWRDFAATVCGVGGRSALTADNWNCVYEYVQKSNPELMKNGYLYVDLTGQGNNDTEVGTSTLTHNFVFYRTDVLNPLRLYGNTPDSRVIWWLPNGGGQIRIVSTLSNEIYGVLYLGANSDFGGNAMKVHGQMMVANNANIFGNGAAVETWYDKSVLNDLASQTGMMVGDGINTGTTATGGSTKIAEFYPLAPTLRVRSIAESMEESAVNTTNLVVLGPGVVFNPSFAIVEQGDNRPVADIIRDEGIDTVYVQGATAGTCAPTQTSGATPPWNTVGNNAVTFQSCSRNTTFRVYVLPASDVGMGKGVAQFRDAIRTIDEVVSGDTTYALDVLLNLNHLDGAGKLKFDFSGSTAIEGTDFVLTSPTGKVFDIASGATGTSPLQLQLKIIKDATNNEPDKIIRIQMTSVGNSNLLVSTPSVMLINLRDLNYNTKKLTWLSPYAENGGIIFVSNLGTVQVGGAPNEWLLRQGAKVAIGAVPATNYKVASWTGACAGTTSDICVISSMDTDKEFGLTFKKKAFSLTLQPKNISGGKITFAPTPDSVRVSGKDSILWYEAGTTVTATAVANTSPTPGYSFMGWTGDFAGRTSSPLTVMMDSNVVLGGAFAKPGESCFYDTYDGTLNSMWKGRTTSGAVSSRSWYTSWGWVKVGAGTGTTLLIADTTIQLNGEVEAKIDAGISPDAWLDGLVLRADLSKGTYVSVGYRNAAFQENHIRVCHKNEAMSTETCTEHANEINPGAEVDLRVRALESSFLIYINSVLVATVTADGHDVPGYTGFMVRRTTASFAASTFKWLDGAGCAETGNPPPEISSCQLETVLGVTADPLEIKQGEALIMTATIKDVNGLVADAVRYTVTTTDGFATQSGQVIYSGGDIEHGVEKNTGVHKGVGTFLATLVAKDSRGGEAVCEKTFKVVAPCVNVAPVITALTVDGSAYTGTNLTAGTAHTLVVTATDADNDAPLTYEMSGDLGFMTNTNSAGTATFTLPSTTNGSRTLNITVKDGKGGEATTQMLLKFTGATNSAPVITSCTATPSGGEVPLGVKFMAQAYDPDGDALTYSWSGGDGVSLTGEFPAMFTFRSAANHDVRLEVTDSKGAKSYCNVTVSTTPSTNRAPASPVCTADKTSGTGGLITVKLTGSATDPDGDPVNFRWLLSNGEQVWGNPYSKVLADGNYSVTGIAVDSKGAEARCAPIKITNANSKPKVSLSATPTTGDMEPDGLGNLGLEVTFAPSVSDPDGDATTLAWSVSPSISGFAVDANNRYTFRTVGTYVVTLTATDTKGASASTTKTIIVTQNHAPTVTCTVAPSSPMIGEEVTWTATAVDSDGDPLIATWSGTDGLSGSSKVVKTTYSTTGTKTGTIVVKDEGKLEATATCQTTVVAYVAPCDAPEVLTGGTKTIPANKSVCFAADPGASAKGYMFSVNNTGSASVTMYWYGADNENNTACSQMSRTLNAGNQDNNRVLDRNAAKGKAYLYITNNTATTATVSLGVNSWNNGSGCSTEGSVPPGP